MEVVGSGGFSNARYIYRQGTGPSDCSTFQLTLQLVFRIKIHANIHLTQTDIIQTRILLTCQSEQDQTTCPDR